MKLDQERRRTFRVEVKPGNGIDAVLHFAGKKLKTAVHNISAEALFIKLESGPLATLKIDSKVAIAVSFEGDTVLLQGVIRSEHGGGYGIFFPVRDPTGRANPLDTFERISAHLQRTSLSQRLKVLTLPH